MGGTVALGRWRGWKSGGGLKGGKEVGGGGEAGRRKWKCRGGDASGRLGGEVVIEAVIGEQGGGRGDERVERQWEIRNRESYYSAHKSLDLLVVH